MACSRSPATTSPRMWVEETISPSTSTSGDDPRLERGLRAQQVGVALGLVAEAEVLPHRDLRRAELADEHVVDELLRRLGGELAVERDHDELAHPEPGDEVGLDVERGQQLGRGVGRDDRRGCGSNVSTVSAPRITSRWPRCTPSNSRPRRAAARRSASGSQVTPSAAEAYDGLEVPVRAWLCEGDQAVVVHEPHRRPPRRRAPPRRGRRSAAPRPARVTAGRKASAELRGMTSSDASAASNGADPRAPQLHAVGVAEVGHQGPDVGARRALDREARAVALAPQLLEARDLDLALGQLDRLPARASSYARRPPTFTAL